LESDSDLDIAFTWTRGAGGGRGGEQLALVGWFGFGWSNWWVALALLVRLLGVGVCVCPPG